MVSLEKERVKRKNGMILLIVVIVVLVIVGIYLYFSNVINFKTASAPSAYAPEGSPGQTGTTEFVIACGESQTLQFIGGVVLSGTGEGVGSTKSEACSEAKTNCNLDVISQGQIHAYTPGQSYTVRCKTESCNIPDKCQLNRPYAVTSAGPAYGISPTEFGECDAERVRNADGTITYEASVDCSTTLTSNQNSVIFSCTQCIADQERPTNTP